MSYSTISRTQAIPLVEDVACNLCGSSRRVDRFSFDLSIGTVKLVRCTDCGLHFLSPRPVLAELGRFYPADYYSFKDPSPPDPAPNASFKQRLRETVLADQLSYATQNGMSRVKIPSLATRPLKTLVGLPAAKPGGALLDIGCGSGTKLLELRRLGWTVTGLEISESAASAGRSHGLEIVCGSVDDLLAQGRAFDAITMYHALEHMPDPRRTLESVAKLLTPGGELLIVVPNFNSLERRIYGSRWPWLDVPVHLYHFEPAPLARLVQSAGLKIDHIAANLAGHSEGYLPAWAPSVCGKLVHAGFLALNAALAGTGLSKAIMLSARRPPNPSTQTSDPGCSCNCANVRARRNS
jgi:SAM-dependent methyltransferase